MGKNPNMIFRELYRYAKSKQTSFIDDDKTDKLDRTIHELSMKDNIYYILYAEAVRKFLIEGYSEDKALRHITQWANYDMASPIKYKGYKLLGLAEVI